MHDDQEQDAIRLADKGSCSDCQHPMADKMADFALETQGKERYPHSQKHFIEIIMDKFLCHIVCLRVGASVISTRCSETYRIRSACVTLFGFPLWYPSESPRTVIQV